jgi:Holliday junction resolvasome RuvABC endonuclease subunit
MIHVLGLDPGFAYVGWAVMGVLPNPTMRKMVPIAAGVIETVASKKKQKVGVGDDDFRRTKYISMVLADLCKTFDVRLICMEEMSSPPNSMTSKKMAFCIGAIAALCQVLDIPLTQVNPKRIKKYLTNRMSSTTCISDEHKRRARLDTHIWPIWMRVHIARCSTTNVKRKRMPPRRCVSRGTRRICRSSLCQWWQPGCKRVTCAFSALT